MDRPNMPILASSLSGTSSHASNSKKTTRHSGDSESQKRRCISTACIACRRRKSKCDGALPSCASCASVYGTECIYNPNSDHRRKGVYRERLDNVKGQSSTLQIIVEAILNAAEDEVPDVVNRIRTCENLDIVAQELLKLQNLQMSDSGQAQSDEQNMSFLPVEGERDLAGKMGELRLENGCLRFIGGTSHLLFLRDPSDGGTRDLHLEPGYLSDNPVTTWTRVTADPFLTIHLLNMYFNYHYPFFTTLSRELFWRDFMKGRAGQDAGTTYCSSFLVNVMLSLGCHFSDVPGAYGTPGDSKTKGDHFFAEAKRLMMENEEFEKPCLVTVQALALMSMREAGCARETQGWVYSGMSFRMALDIGLNLEVEGHDRDYMTDEEVDARRITFWGCFLFDKCWSNYLGRLPQLPKNCFNVSKFDVFPDEDAALWSPLTDKGFDEGLAQPSRTRAVALQLSKLCEITSDLLLFFYHPSYIKKPSAKFLELKRLSDLHQRLEEWRKDLPREFEAKEGQLPNVLLMHAFFHLQYIHLFRPFLKYPPSASPLPSHISPRRICTANAGAISKLMRVYKKSWNLRQICNIAVYVLHNACTIHLLNLPEKTAKRDITHGLKHLEDIAEDWLCARRTLSIISVLARKWNCELPDEAALVLKRTDEKYDCYSTSEVPSPRSSNLAPSPQAVMHEMHEEEEAAMASGSWSGKQEVASSSRPPFHPMENQTATAAAAAAATATQTYNIGQHANFNTGLPGVPGGGNVVRPRRDVGMGADQMVFNQGIIAGGWTQHPAPMSSMSMSVDALGTLAPTNRSGMGSERGGLSQSSNSMRSVPQGQGFNVDSREWILTDSARLHQTFGSWQEGEGCDLFMLGDGGDGSLTTLPPLGNQDLDSYATLAESLLSLNRDQFLPPGPG